MNPGESIRLDLPANYQSLSVVSAVLAEILKNVDPLPDCEQITFAVQLAAHEVCVNIVKHAYKGAPEERIQIDITLADDPMRIIIRTVDHGNQFDITEVPHPDEAEPQVHGYGLFLVRQLMDEARYESHDDGNIWHLVKYL